MTPLPRPSAVIGSGSMSRTTARKPTNSAEPVMMSACTRPAIASDLPCPNRCSRSGGSTATRSATKVTDEATRSSSESASEPSSATEPVATTAQAFRATSVSATLSDAAPATRSSLARSASGRSRSERAPVTGRRDAARRARACAPAWRSRIVSSVAAGGARRIPRRGSRRRRARSSAGGRTPRPRGR